jgi:hypothetical protein
VLENFKKLQPEFDTVFAELKAATEPTRRQELLRTLRQLIRKVDSVVDEFEAEFESADLQWPLAGKCGDETFPPSRPNVQHD